jgi:hypothetical protein
MIKIRESVPSVYYNSSRDFQLVAHLFDLVLNSVKTEADILFSLPFSTNSPDQLLDLMAFTFGLRLSKNKYTADQLRAICSVAPQMMKQKGNISAVQLLCTALVRADHVVGGFKVDPDEEAHTLTIYITSYATCGGILREILPYILPAGMTFNIKPAGLYEQQVEALDKYTTIETAQHAKVKNTSTITPIIGLDASGATIKLIDTNSVAPGVLTYNADGSIKDQKSAILDTINVYNPAVAEGEKQK